MAKIISQSVDITFSTLVRNSDDVNMVLTKEHIETLEAAIAELFGDETDLVVEVVPHD